MITKLFEQLRSRLETGFAIRSSAAIAVIAILIGSSGSQARGQASPVDAAPVLQFASYLGGSQYDIVRAIAVDECGNTYVAGGTASLDFPVGTTPSTDLSRPKGGADAFVSKISADGSTVLFTAFLGGTGDEGANGVAVDASGAIYVTGSTPSADFPTTHTIGEIMYPGDAFVAKIDASGSKLIFSTRFGGEHGDGGKDIAVDDEGNTYITGWTSSDRFPVRNAIFPREAYQDDLGEEIDAFLAKLSPDGSQFEYATYLGGMQDEIGYGVDIDPAGNAYVTGRTTSQTFPEYNPISPPDLSEPFRTFVTKVNPRGDALVYSTTILGASTGFDIAADDEGNAYVTGPADPDFPTTSEPYPFESHGDIDAFLCKIEPMGGAFVYSVLLGGSLAEYGASLGVDALGTAYVAGETTSGDFPFRRPGSARINDIFVAAVAPDGTTLQYAMMLGTTTVSSAKEPIMAVDSAGNLSLATTTQARDYPLRNAFQPSVRGVSDVYIARFSSGRYPAPMPASARSIVRPGKPFRLEIVGSAFQPGIQVFIGDDPAPVAGRFKSCSKIRLKGAELETRFPIGVAVTIRIVNPDGGEASTQFTR